VIASVVLLGGVEVVTLTAEGEIRGGWLPALAEWIEVVELELVARVATVAGAAHERASAIVALPDLAADGDGNIPAARRRRVRRSLLASATAPTVDAL
jgi:hypothetical protein